MQAYCDKGKPPRLIVVAFGAWGWRLDDRTGWEILVASYLEPIENPGEAVRTCLAKYPRFGDCAARISSVLSIAEACRPWLCDVRAKRLTEAAHYRNDAIYQMAECYGGRVLANEVRRAARDEQASDMEAISAFVLACAAHALQALLPILAGEQGCADDWEWHELYLGSVDEVVRGCAVHSYAARNPPLSAHEIDACFEIAGLAEEAAFMAARSADGYRGVYGSRSLGSGMIEGRRQLDGTDARDEAIRIKALELIASGTKRHNLSSKLRVWQEKETGKSLSKPAMNSILKRFNLHC